MNTITTPNIIEPLDFESTLSERKANFLARWGADVQKKWADTLELESEPVTKVLEESAYRELLLRARINHAARAQFLAFAGENDLDYLAEFYGVIRKENESDAHFRERTRERIRASSAAGGAAWYRYHALSASEKVTAVHVDSPRAGLVRIAILIKKGEDKSQVMAQVRDYLNRDDVKVLTDTLQIQAAETFSVDIRAKVWLLPDAAADMIALEQRLRLATAQLKLGRDLSRSWLIHQLHQLADIARVELITPKTNIIINANQAATLGKVELIFMGRAY